MEQEQAVNIQISEKKIYIDREINVGTFLGGPLVAGYLIAENYKVFNQDDKVRKTWIYTIIATIVIFGLVFFLPDSIKIPNQLIPIIYTGITYYLVKHFQEQSIRVHLGSGGQHFNWWRTIGVSLIGLAITFSIFFVAVYFSVSATNTATSSKTYGITKNEIDYDKSNISESEVDGLAYGLTHIAFFDQASTKFVFAKKNGKDYELYFSCDRSIKNNAIALNWFGKLRTNMQVLYPNSKIVFNLVVDNLDNVVKRLE